MDEYYILVKKFDQVDYLKALRDSCDEGCADCPIKEICQTCFKVQPVRWEIGNG